MSTNVTEYPPNVQYIVDHPEKIFGAWFCGGVGDFILTGALISMIADYWQRYRRSDTLLYKILVDICLVMSLLRSIQTAAICWHKMVIGFGDYYAAAYSSPWFFAIQPLFTELLCLIAQSFFVIRLWRMLGGLRLLLLPLVPAILMGFAGHIALTVQVYHLKTLEDLASFKTTSYVALVGVVASDVIVTLASSWYLHASKTGRRISFRTDSLIGRLLHLTWVTAAFPTIASLLNLITYVTLSASGDATFIAFDLVAPKLYCVSMMYTLNSRQSLVSGENSYHMSSNVGRTNVAVNVTTNTVQFADPRDHDENSPTAVKFTTGTPGNRDRDDFDQASRDTDMKSPIV